MNFFLQIMIFLLIDSTCSGKITEKQEIGTPDLSELISSIIEYLDNEHKIIFHQAEKEDDNFKDLVNGLSQLRKFDINRIHLNQFHQKSENCNGLRKRVWKNENFTLVISNFETFEQNNQIELIQVNVDSENYHSEMLLVSDGSLEYLRINDKKYNPIHESRMVGMDEAIRKFKINNCR